jgi:large subunit ribosomal protein L10
MALTKEEKQAQVTALQERLQRAKSLLFVDICGLSVDDATDVRQKLHDRQAELKVAKKTLFHIAAQRAGYPEVPEELLKGSVGFIFSFRDEIGGAEVAREWGSRKGEALPIIGGVLEGKLLSRSDAEELAQLLPHEELLAKFAAMLQAPLVQFAGMCQNALPAFVRALEALRSKKQEVGASPSHA